MEGSGGKAYSGKRRKNKREGVVMKEYVVWEEEDKLAKHKEKDGCVGSSFVGVGVPVLLCTYRQPISK